MSRRDDVHAIEMRRDAQETSPTHIRMLHNAQKWHMTLAAPLYLHFLHGRFVDFLRRCFSSRRSYQIAPDRYESHINLKPLFLAFMRAIICPYSAATIGAICPDILDHGI